MEGGEIADGGDVPHVTFQIRLDIYYFRDQQGLEVDFVVPSDHRQLILVEAKASRTVVPQMADPIDRLSMAISRYRVSPFIVHPRQKRQLGYTRFGPEPRRADWTPS